MADANREMAADVRKVLKKAHEKGVEEGEQTGYEKGLQAASRKALLDMHADGMEKSSSLVEDEAAEAALIECAGILRDLVERGADGVGRRVRRRSVTASNG